MIIIILLEQCIHEFWACSFASFFVCPLPFSLSISCFWSCVRKNVVVAIGWGECSLGATSVFNAHSKRKMQIFHATFRMCLCECFIIFVLSSLHTTAFLTLYPHKYTDFNIFYSFSYSFGDYYYVLMFQSFFPLFRFSRRMFFILHRQLFRTYTFDIIKIKLLAFLFLLFCSYVNLWISCKQLGSFLLPKQTCNLWMHLRMHKQHS